MTWQQKSQELWGERWKAVLTHMTLMNRSTVRRWCNGQTEAPQWLIDAVEETYRIWVGN